MRSDWHHDTFRACAGQLRLMMVGQGGAVPLVATEPPKTSTLLPHSKQTRKLQPPFAFCINTSYTPSSSHPRPPEHDPTQQHLPRAGISIMAADKDASAPTTGEDTLALSLTSSSTILRTTNLEQLNDRILSEGLCSPPGYSGPQTDYCVQNCRSNRSVPSCACSSQAIHTTSIAHHEKPSGNASSPSARLQSTRRPS